MSRTTCQATAWVLLAALAAPAQQPAAGDLAEIEQMAYALFQCNRATLLADRRVRSDLGLDQAQAAAGAQLAAAADQVTRAVQRLRPDERRQRMQAEFLPATQQMDRQIRATLRPEQLTRLDQVVMRNQIGAIALVMPGVPEWLRMSPEQRYAVRAIVDENLRAVNWDKFDTLIEKARVARLAKAGRERALAALTPAQRQQWVAAFGR